MNDKAKLASLWAVLAISTPINALGPLFGVHPAARLAAGVVSVVCVGLLITVYALRRTR